MPEYLSIYAVFAADPLDPTRPNLPAALASRIAGAVDVAALPGSPSLHVWCLRVPVSLAKFIQDNAGTFSAGTKNRYLGRTATELKANADLTAAQKQALLRRVVQRTDKAGVVSQIVTDQNDVQPGDVVLQDDLEPVHWQGEAPGIEVMEHL